MVVTYRDLIVWQEASAPRYELQTQLEIAKNLQYLHDPTHKNLYKFTREIERMLTSLISKLRP